MILLCHRLDFLSHLSSFLIDKSDIFQELWLELSGSQYVHPRDYDMVQDGRHRKALDWARYHIIQISFQKSLS